MPDSFIHRFTPGSGSGPLLLLLHGTGGHENALLGLGRALDPTAPLLSPRGKVSENGMPRFFRRLSEGVFDEADLIAQTRDLAAFIEAARRVYQQEDRKLVAVGYSNGANMAASLLLQYPGLLDGAILLRAMVPLHPSREPELTGRPVLLAAGRHDPMIPAQESERLARLLEAFGAEVSLVWEEGGHELATAEIDDASQWLASHFGEPAPTV